MEMANRIAQAVFVSLATGASFLGAIASPGNAEMAPSFSQVPAGNASPQPSRSIQQLQARLTELGYYSGAIDGQYSQATRDALASFQQSVGLVGTGILDPLTQERLKNPNAGASPVPAEMPTPAPSADPTVPSSPPVPSAETPAPAPPAPEASLSPNPATAGAAPSEAVPPEAAPDGQEKPDGKAAKETDPKAQEKPDNPSKERNLLSLVLWGVALLGIGGMGTALTLFLARREPQGKGRAEPGVEAPRAIAGRATVPPLQNGTLRSPHSPVAHPASDRSGKWSGDDSTALAIAGGAEPRLARVNIIDELIEELNNPDPSLRHKAIWELGQRGNSAAVQPLSMRLLDADSQEQGLILAALAEIGMKTLKPVNRAIALALQNENPEVRKNAIRDISRVYDSLGQVGRLLGQAAADSDPEVRQTASWALTQLEHLRLSAMDTGRLLQEDIPAQERLSEDESSSRKG